MADMNVALIVELVDKLTGPSKRVANSINDIGRAGKTMSARLTELDQGFRRITQGAGRIALGAGYITGAIGAAAGTVYGFVKNQLLPVGQQFENFTVQLKALEGSEGGAKRALAWITDFAVKTPLELDGVVAAYTRLKAYGIDPTKGSLRALVDTMAMYGGGQEKLMGLIMGVGQAWTKQKLQGEEILQLLERGVPVWEILSDKLGMNVQRLQELSSKGKLGRDAIQALVQGMAERAIGASEEMSKTWEGMTSNIGDAILQIKLAIMNAGLYDFMKAQLKGVLDFVNQLSAPIYDEFGRKRGTLLEQWAKRISDAFITILKTGKALAVGLFEILRPIGRMILSFKDLIGGWENFGKVLAGLVLAPGFLLIGSGLAKMAGGLWLVGKNGVWLVKNGATLAKVIAEAGAAGQQLNMAGGFSLAIRGIGGLTTALSGLTLGGMIGGLASLAAAAAPLILIAVAIAAIGGVIYRYWDRISAFFGGMWDGFTDAASPAIAELRDALQPVLEALAPVLDLVAAGWEKIKSAISAVVGFFADLWQPVETTSEQMQEFADRGRGWGEAIGKFITTPFRVMARVIRGLLNPIETLKGLFSDLWDVVPDFLKGPLEQIGQVGADAGALAKSALDAVDLSSSGASMMNELASGIRSRIDAVKAAASEAAASVRDYFPHSPAKLGPLRDLHRVDFGGQLARAFNADPLVSRARLAAGEIRSAFAAAGGPGGRFAPAAAGAGGRSMTISFGDIYVNGAGGPEKAAESVARQFQDRLRRALHDGGYEG